jgi:hypothetical protein
MRAGKRLADFQHGLGVWSWTFAVGRSVCFRIRPETLNFEGFREQAPNAEHPIKRQSAGEGNRTLVSIPLAVAYRTIVSLFHCGVESKRGRIRRVKHWKTALAIWAVLSASLALGEDFKTIDGKEYKNAKVSRVEPDGIVLLTKSGISKVYFAELPKEVRERFHYDAQQAAQYTSQTVEQNRLAQERKVEEDEKRAEKAAKRKAEQEVLRQQRDAEMRRQQWEAEHQREQRGTEQQQQAEIQRAPASTPSVSKEGIPEHTYEILQDHTVLVNGSRIRLRRGEQYHGRILVDHAEIDINGISYNVPSGILSAPKD